MLEKLGQRFTSPSVDRRGYTSSNDGDDRSDRLTLIYFVREEERLITLFKKKLISRRNNKSINVFIKNQILSFTFNLFNRSFFDIV